MSGFVSLGTTVCADMPVVMLVTLPFVCPVVFENVDDQLAAVFNQIISVIVPIELAAGALVVRNVAGVSAVGKLFFHLGQMVGADMAGS